MSEIVLQAELRTQRGKKAKQVRMGGKVPGVFYAHGEESLPIAVGRPNLDPLIYTSKAHVIDLRLSDGTSKKCILRDVQFDPVSDRPIHFDLQGLRENEKLTLEIPVVLTGGTPIGVREGGMLQQIVHKLRITCFPRDIPEKIDILVSDLAMNHFVHVRDLSVPNATILENPDNPVVGVVPPTVHKEPEVPVEAEEGILEPEVVGKGKKPEEGEEAEEEGEEGKRPAGAKPEPK